MDNNIKSDQSKQISISKSSKDDTNKQASKAKHMLNNRNNNYNIHNNSSSQVSNIKVDPLDSNSDCQTKTIDALKSRNSYLRNKCWKESSKVGIAIIKSVYWKVFAALFTFLLLVISDISYLAIDHTEDPIIEGVYTAGLAFLVLEMLLNSIFISHYRFSFFFFIDLFAVVCLFPDIPFIEVPIFNPKHLTYIDKSAREHE